MIAGPPAAAKIASEMAELGFNGSGPRVLRGAAAIGGRAAALSVRPFTGLVGAAAGAGMELERRAMDRLIDSGEMERLLASNRVQTVASQVLDSDGARRLVDAFFDSGMFDQLVDRLLASDALWRLVDEVAASPSVTAAVSQQGLGFADQVGDQMRTRSREADAWLERFVRRFAGRGPGPGEAPPAPDPA